MQLTGISHTVYGSRSAPSGPQREKKRKYTETNFSGVFSQRRPQISFGALVWVLVFSTLPIHKLITNQTGLYTYLVLGLIIGFALLGRVARPPGAALWAVCIPLILVASLLSGIYSSIPRSLIVGAQLSIVVGIAPFVLRYYVLNSAKFTRYSLVGFLIVQTLSSIAGLIQLTGVSVFGMVANSGRANGLATHPNILGLMASLAVLLCLAGAYRSRGRLRLLSIAAATVNLAALIASGSLSSMLSLAGGVIVLLLASRATVRTIALSAIFAVSLTVGGALLGFEYTIFTDPVEGRVNTVLGISDDGVASVSIRQATYEFAIESIQNDPISGVGMDPMNQGTFNATTVVHNYLLRSWYQGGVLLFAALASITVFFICRVLRSIAKGSESLQSAAIATIIIFALTSAFYTQQQYWLPLIFAAAHLAKTPRHTQSESAAR